MKLIKRIVLPLLLILIVVGVVLQLVLQFRLGALIREHALPPMQDKMGVSAELDGASINLMRGASSIKGLRIGNAGWRSFSANRASQLI